MMGLRGFLTMGSANVISSAIMGIFWIYLASLLGTTNYGEVSYFLAISVIASVISSLGSGTTLMVFTAKEVKIQPAVYLLTIVSSSATSLILFFIFYNIGVSTYVLGFVIFSLVINELLGRKSYKEYSKLIITQKILQVGLALGLYYAIGIQGIILGFGLSFFPYVIRIYHGFKESKINFSLLKSHFGFMMNSYVLDISRTFAGSIDKLIISPIFGFAILGNYQLGIQFLSILSLLPNVVFQYVLAHDATGTSNKKLKTIAILISILLAIITILLSPILLPFFFPEFDKAVVIVQIVSLAIIPVTINTIYVSKFLASEKTRIVLVGSGIYLLIQISAIYILGKSYETSGIAWALVLANTAESFYLFLMNYSLKKRTKLDKTSS